MRGADQVDALLLERGLQLVTVVGLVPNQSSRAIGDGPTLKCRSLRTDLEFL